MVWKLIGAFVAGVVVASLSALATLYLLDLEVVEKDFASGPAAGMVVVPDVTFHTFQTARAEIEGLGLTARLIGKPEVECEFGIGGSTCRDPNPPISSQTPEAGAEAPTGATVTLDGGG